MEEQKPLRALTPEHLAEYDGPKIGKHLRREMKQQATLLYEKVMLLRLLDPRFERSLKEMGALEFLDRYTDDLRKAQEQRRTQAQEQFGRLLKKSGAPEEPPAE